MRNTVAYQSGLLLSRLGLDQSPARSSGRVAPLTALLRSAARFESTAACGNEAITKDAKNRQNCTKRLTAKRDHRFAIKRARMSTPLTRFGEPGVVTRGTAGTEIFRYRRHAAVLRFTAEGWQANAGPRWYASRRILGKGIRGGRRPVESCRGAAGTCPQAPRR